MNYVKQNTKVIGFVASALMILGNFLPFVTASIFGLSSSQTLMSGDNTILGIIAIILEAVMILLYQKDKKKFTLIPIAIVFIFLLICKSGYSDYGSLVSMGIGFYLILIGCILGVVGAFADEIFAKIGTSTNHTEKKFCRHCGAEMKADAEFCPKCGEKN